MATEVNSGPNLGIQELKTRMTTLQQEKAKHVAAAAEIDNTFLEMRQQLDAILGEVTENTQKTNPGKTSKRGRPAGSQNKGGTRASRNGETSGTKVIEDILLAQEGHQMKSGDLRAAAIKKGIKHPSSSFQSLQRRKRMDLKDGIARLVDAA